MRCCRILTVALALIAPSLAAQVRLDTTSMRNNLFAALAGDREAANRLVTESEQLLAVNPDHAQALVWHGVTLLATGFPNPSSTAEEQQAAIARFQKGMAEVDRAVEFAPNDIEVRALRGVALRPMSRQMPPPFSERMLEKARSDFQQIFDMQKDELDRLGTHPLGELLQALGDVYARQSKPDDAAKYYRLIEMKLSGTEYARRAALWSKTRQPLPPDQTACLGCHVG